MKEIKSVRIRKRYINTGTLDIKVTLNEDKHTFGSDDRILIGTNNDKVVWSPTTYKKSGLYKDFTDDQFIENFILLNSKIDGGGSTYDIIQDPWEIKVPKWRSYGFDPYYLNNGAFISISWLNGTTTAGGKKYSDSNGDELTDSEKGYITKTVTISSGQGKEKIITLNKNGIFDYGFLNSQEFSGLIKDIDIIDLIIAKWTTKIPNYKDLSLCSPNNESCSTIEYKSPMEITPEVVKGENIPTNEAKKEVINVILPETIKVRIDTTFKIFIGKSKELNTNLLQDDEITDLSEEYTEEPFVGSEEAPLDLKDIGTSFDNVQETSPESSYNPANITPGKIVSLPINYSHTSSQGFNLLNSQWIGDLITSALSHIKHPTYDIEGTEQGALGCASAVSMIFYRAFGVHMKTGKSIKSNPKSIGDFGSKGTGELAGWLSNGNLYTRVSWQNAQPGDILNTARGSKAGHIGVVINTKNSDGSWNVVSNSSKGFEGGGGGAVKQNYSVKKWQSVADRNPSETFAYRYIGPKISSGQAV